MIKDLQKIPADWKRVKLGEVVENLKTVELKGVSPYLEISDIDVSTKLYSIKDKPAPSNCLYAKKNDILISKVRPTRGAVSLVRDNLLFVSPALLVIRACNYNFQFYIVTQGKFFNYLGLLETGTTYPSVNDEDILKYEFPLPPLPEQEKIAEILETVDNAIEKTDKIIRKYKRIKQGLMQDLLTKGIDSNWQIRSEKTHKFKDSPLGRIPADWEVGSVTDFAELNPKVEINPDNTYPFVEMDAVPIMGKNYSYLTYRKGKEAGSKFRGKDILLARITPCAENGKALLVPTNIDVGIGSTEFIVFRAKQQVNSNFLFYLLISTKVRLIAIALMEGTSGRQRIPNYVFQSVVKVAIPPLTEQERIASVLSQVDAVIEKETAYRDKLSRIKQGLMEDLLTGKVRVTALLENENNQYQKEDLYAENNS